MLSKLLNLNFKHVVKPLNKYLNINLKLDPLDLYMNIAKIKNMDKNI